MARDRRLILALAALSPCYLSGVIGRMSIPVGVDEERPRAGERTLNIDVAEVPPRLAFR